MTDAHPVASDGQIQDDDDAAGENLNPREILFVDALALGHTLGDAATAARISARSGRRWKTKPEIAAAIRVRMTENISVGRAILAAGMSKAATALVAMASGEAVADSARVSACRAVVEGASKLLEIDGMVARLAQLEARLEVTGANGDPIGSETENLTAEEMASRFLRATRICQEIQAQEAAGPGVIDAIEVRAQPEASAGEELAAVDTVRRLQRETS